MKGILKYEQRKNKQIKRVSKRKKKVTKLVMKITSTLKRSYHYKVAPSPATAPFDLFPIGVSADSCPAGVP